MAQLYDFEVSHPDHPTVIISSIGPDSASLSAGRRWELSTGEWAQIAFDITVRRLGQTVAPRCRRCGGKAKEAGLCVKCTRADAMHRRELAQLRRPDRRTVGAI